MALTTGAELKKLRESQRLTMQEFSDLLGVTKSRYQNWEYDKAEPPNGLIDKARALARGDEVTSPTVPAPKMKIQIPYIGQVAASTPVDWSDPFESEEFEFVPYEMGDGRGRFAAKVVGLSMYPLLMPGDLVVFQSSNIPKLGIVVLHRSNDNRVTIKQLKHDGDRFMLVSTNSEVPTVAAEGLVIGHLVGIVREQGLRVTTEFDPSGISP